MYLLRKKPKCFEIWRTYNRITAYVKFENNNNSWLTGTFSRIFRKHLSNIARRHDIEEECTAAILGSAHILGKGVMCK